MEGGQVHQVVPALHEPMLFGPVHLVALLALKVIFSVTFPCSEVRLMGLYFRITKVLAIS